MPVTQHWKHWWWRCAQQPAAVSDLKLYYKSMITVALNTLNKGMTGDPRDRSGAFRVMKHFNNEVAHKLTPYYDMELDAVAGFEATLDVFQITRILKAANGKFYGFGQIAASDAHAQVYIKTSPLPNSTPTKRLNWSLRLFRPT
jgi:hypothetical protein